MPKLSCSSDEFFDANSDPEDNDSTNSKEGKATISKWALHKIYLFKTNMRTFLVDSDRGRRTEHAKDDAVSANNQWKSNLQIKGIYAIGFCSGQLILSFSGAENLSVGEVWRIRQN